MLPYDAALLTANRETADYFEATVAASDGQPKLSANWVMGDVMAALNREGKDITQSPISPALLGGMLVRIADGTISGKIAKEVFEALWNGESDADEIIRNRGLKQVTDTAAIAVMIDEVLQHNPSQVSQYRSGKEQLLAYFVGQVMKNPRAKPTHTRSMQSSNRS